MLVLLAKPAEFLHQDQLMLADDLLHVALPRESQSHVPCLQMMCPLLVDTLLHFQDQ